ncbi:RNA-directed DNA polymerase, eukaryota, reverse transcriptase zinc-binding domain protein [Tanacetum coccineum]
MPNCPAPTINIASANHLVHPTDTTPIITNPVIRPNSSRDSVGLSFSWAWRRAVRLQDELLELTDLQNLIINLRLSMEQDTWEFTPEPSRFFKDNTMRKIISNTSTDSTSQQTRWNKILPSKVNILAWRVLLHRLPTRVNLDHRGIDLDSVRCPLCNDDIETETHVFVNCSLARCIWKDVFSWWQLPNTSITNLDDLFSLPDRVTMESKLKPFFDVVINASIWSLWSYRNKMRFNIKRPQKNLIFNEIKLSSFNWITSRSKRKVSFSWLDWFRNPCNSLSSQL